MFDVGRRDLVYLGHSENVENGGRKGNCWPAESKSTGGSLSNSWGSGRRTSCGAGSAGRYE